MLTNTTFDFNNVVNVEMLKNYCSF